MKERTRTVVINESRAAKVLEQIRIQTDESMGLLRNANNELKEENAMLRKEVDALRQEVCRLRSEVVDSKNKLFEATQTTPFGSTDIQPMTLDIVKQAIEAGSRKLGPHHQWHFEVPAEPTEVADGFVRVTPDIPPEAAEEALKEISYDNAMKELL